MAPQNDPSNPQDSPWAPRRGAVRYYGVEKTHGRLAITFYHASMLAQDEPFEAQDGVFSSQDGPAPSQKAAETFQDGSKPPRTAPIKGL